MTLFKRISEEASGMNLECFQDVFEPTISWSKFSGGWTVHRPFYIERRGTMFARPKDRMDECNLGKGSRFPLDGLAEFIFCFTNIRDLQDPPSRK